MFGVNWGGKVIFGSELLSDVDWNWAWKEASETWCKMFEA
jgi:hypothetical protein